VRRQRQMCIRDRLYSEQSINQIALDLGYKDPAYFARFFNRMMGCSPTQFRGR
ncbi:helix-turn-helix domain-containing protein, partial [Escherichia coli]